MDKKVEQIFDFAKAGEERYYELSGKAMGKGNNMAMLLHQAEASAFQRVRYFIEMLEEKESQK